MIRLGQQTRTSQVMREPMRIRGKVQEIESRSFFSAFLQLKSTNQNNHIQKAPNNGDVPSGEGDHVKPATTRGLGVCW